MGKKTCRNGYYERELKTFYGHVSLMVSKERMSLFKTRLLEPYRRTANDLEFLVQWLYLKGLALAD